MCVIKGLMICYILFLFLDFNKIKVCMNFKLLKNNLNGLSESEQSPQRSKPNLDQNL